MVAPIVVVVAEVDAAHHPVVAVENPYPTVAAVELHSVADHTPMAAFATVVVAVSVIETDVAVDSSALKIPMQPVLKVDVAEDVNCADFIIGTDAVTPPTLNDSMVIDVVAVLLIDPETITCRSDAVTPMSFAPPVDVLENM